jgi:uncharacterized membrane protein YeaQ/YmgE (transglycosylase-associated protein family)
MTQLSFMVIGLAIGVLYTVVRGPARVRSLTALAVGLFGGWVGALLFSTKSFSGWRGWSALSLLGAVLGAVGSLALLDRFVLYSRRHDRVG